MEKQTHEPFLQTVGEALGLDRVVCWIERKLLYAPMFWRKIKSWYGWRIYLLMGIAVLLIIWWVFIILNSHYEWITDETRPSTLQTTIIEDEPIGSLWDGTIDSTTFSRASSDLGQTATPTLTPLASPTPTVTSEPNQTTLSSPAIKVSESEYELFCRIIALEGDPRADDPYELYLQVATVILNRVKSDQYPETITAVIAQKNQFSTYRTTRKPVYVEAVYKSADDALNGKRNLPEDILYFCTESAYKRQQRSGGFFSTLKLYKIDNGVAWCCLP